MGWLEDLAALKDQIDVGGKVGTAAHKAVDLINLPSDIGKEVYGQAQTVAQGQGIGKAGLTGLETGLNVVEKGYQLPGKLALEGGVVPGAVPVIGGRELGVQPAFRKIAEGITKLPGAGKAFEDAPKTAIERVTDAITRADLNRIDAAGMVPTTPMVRLAHKNLLAQGLPDPLLDAADNAVFATKLKTGLTYGQALEAGEQVAKQDMSDLAATGVQWDAGTRLDDRVKALEAFPDVAKMVKKYGTMGIDPLHADDPRNISRLVLGKTVAKENGVEHARSVWPSLLKGMWVEQTLATPHNVFANLTGNAMMMAATGHVPPRNYKEFLSTFQAALGGEDVISRSTQIASTYAAQVARKYGMAGPPEQLFRNAIRDVELGGTRGSQTAIGEVTSRLTRSQRAGKVVSYIPKKISDATSTADTVASTSLWSHGFADSMEQRLPAWEAEVMDTGKSIPGFTGIDVANNINVPADGLFQLPVRNELIRQGMQPGQAEQMARRLATVRNAASADGLALKERVMFSGNRTNLDQWVGKVIPFHYWMSRSTRFWMEESMQNPALATTYMKYTQGMEDADKDPGLSARQKGFLHVLGTPLGFSMLMNPDSLFGLARFMDLDKAVDEPVMVMNEDGQMVPNTPTPFKPEGETLMGGALNWMKDKGLGLYPWIDGTINLMGVYGNTFEPDLLGIRHKTLVGAALNTILAHTGQAPWGAPYADAMGQLRGGTSRAFAAMAPDWLAQPVEPRPGGSAQEATLDILIESEIARNNPGLTNADLLEVMSDPDHPEYKKAYQHVADAGLVEQLLNFTLPIQFKARHDAKDVRTAQISEIRDAASAQGVAPFRFTPLPGDIEFAARYKRLTGNEWRPTDYEDAKTKNDLIRAPMETKPFIQQQGAYYDLGTPAQQKMYEQYSALKYGDDPRTAGIADDGAREEMANTWLSRSGNMAAYDDLNAQRRAFEQTHPEWQEYIGWRNQMYDLQTQLGGSLGEYRRQASAQNPNAARYFESKWAWIQQTFPDPEEQKKQYDNATLSAAAFAAITGKGTMRQSQGPIAGVPAADVTLPTMAPPSTGGGGGYDWSRELRRITAL
jgi:hypothetical protein